MIIWLASYPRSGNTFFRLVLRQAFGLPTYSVYDEFGVDDRQVELVGGATASNLEDLARRDDACVVKTHELPGDDAHRAIYIVRDGRDVVVSYANYICNMQKRSPAQDATAVMRDLIMHEQSFGGWGPHVRRWLARTPAPVLIEFADLIADPLRVVSCAMSDAGAPLGKAQNKPLPSFKALRRDMPQFFRTGRVGGFRDAMPEEVQAIFWARYADVMAQCGYERT